MPNKRRKKEDIDPHVCLECGSELSRGRDSNKSRHWKQCHKKSEKDCRSVIVPKSHEKAKSLLKQKQLAHSKKILIPIQRQIDQNLVIDDFDADNQRKSKEDEIFESKAPSPGNFDEPNEEESQE